MSAPQFEEPLRRLLRRRGTAITLADATRTGSTSDLTATGSVASETRTCSPPVPVKVSFVDGENILAGDLETRVAASDWLTVTPAAGQTATIGAESYSVVEAMPLRDKDTIYEYQLRLRGTN